MDFQNLSISRVIIHQVFKRQADRQIIQPVYGTSVTQLGGSETGALQDRVLAALGSGSKCMEMSIISAGQDSALHLARTLVDADQTLFVDQSKGMADLLAIAQKGLSIPGGILVVFAGTANYPPKRIIGMIKAEPHEGFTFDTIQGGLALKYLQNLILTPQTRLYKIGTFVETDASVSADGSADGWEAYVYDDLILPSDRDRAAQYFYGGFLGCNIPVNAARQTKSFFDLTKKFISSMDIPEVAKVDLNTGLYTYLKVDQSQTIDRNTFANQYLKPDMRDAFTTYMERNNFPATVIAKDLTEVAPLLKRRSVVFGSDVRLSAPADRFKELVKIENIKGDANPDGSVPTWTQITVRDNIRTEQ